MPTYQPGIPTGTVPFNQDFANVQGNFQVADTSFGKDHYAFSDSTSNNGYHKVVHMIANSVTSGGNPNNFPITPPALVPLSGELFTTESNVGLAPDEILWYQSGGGKLAQMTVNLNPVSSANGYTFIPGGLIVQWGTVSSTSNGTVTFSSANIAFPNNCFIVTTQPFYTGAAPNSGAEIAIKQSTLSFDWNFFTSSGSYNGFKWFAIGN